MQKKRTFFIGGIDQDAKTRGVSGFIYPFRIIWFIRKFASLNSGFNLKKGATRKDWLLGIIINDMSSEYGANLFLSASMARQQSTHGMCEKFVRYTGGARGISFTTWGGEKRSQFHLLWNLRMLNESNTGHLRGERDWGYVHTHTRTNARLKTSCAIATLSSQKSKQNQHRRKKQIHKKLQNITSHTIGQFSGKWQLARKKSMEDHLVIP